MQPQVAIGQLNGCLSAAERGNRPGKQAVIRADQDAVAGRDRDGTAGGTHTRIHDRHVHRGRQVGDRLRQHRGAAADIARRHQVRDVDDPGGRRDPGGRAVAGRDESVFQAIVGQEAHVLIDGHDW